MDGLLSAQFAAEYKTKNKKTVQVASAVMTSYVPSIHTWDGLKTHNAGEQSRNTSTQYSSLGRVPREAKRVQSYSYGTSTQPGLTLTFILLSSITEPLQDQNFWIYMQPNFIAVPTKENAVPAFLKMQINISLRWDVCSDRLQITLYYKSAYEYQMIIQWWPSSFSPLLCYANDRLYRLITNHMWASQMSRKCYTEKNFWI